MAAAAGSAAPSASGHGAGAPFAGKVGGGDAQQLGEVNAAARLAGGRFVAADEELLFFLAIAADEFVDGHGEASLIASRLTAISGG
jgi:hypothetical protein